MTLKRVHGVLGRGGGLCGGGGGDFLCVRVVKVRF